MSMFDIGLSCSYLILVCMRTCSLKQLRFKGYSFQGCGIEMVECLKQDRISGAILIYGASGDMPAHRGEQSLAGERLWHGRM